MFIQHRGGRRHRLARRRTGIGLAVAAFTLIAISAGRAQVAPPSSTPEVSEIGGWTEAWEGDGLAFGVAVYNPTGESLDLEWDLGDGSDAQGGPDQRAMTHRYRQDGEYVVRLRVTGSGGFSARRSLDILVRNAPPSIEDLYHDGPILPGRSTLFGSDARDPGDDELTYTWDFGDGSPPVSGVERKELTHTYVEAGAYVVTLTVVDEDGAEAVQTLDVVANPGFLGEVAGEVPRFTFAGESGKASLMNAMPGSRAIPLGNVTNLYTGAAPMGGGVADLSDAMGVCLVHAGFWDDENKAHINFQLTLPSDSPFQERTYVVGWEHPEGSAAPGQLLVNALILGIEPSYEDTKAGAENMEIAPGGGGLGAIIERLSGALGGLVGGAGGAGSIGPGRNWQLTANTGALTIRRVTSERIYGDLTAYLGGVWFEASGTGEATYVEIEGSFAWELDDVARANLLRCDDRPFSIESHTPGAEELNVGFAAPSISLVFSHEIRRETVTPQTIQVGYLNEASRFVPIEGTLLPNPDGRTVQFVPAERLMDAVYYHVRVRGGPSGVRSAVDESLVGDFEWRFGTVVDLLPVR